MSGEASPIPVTGSAFPVGASGDALCLITMKPVDDSRALTGSKPATTSIGTSGAAKLVDAGRVVGQGLARSCGERTEEQVIELNGIERRLSARSRLVVALAAAGCLVSGSVLLAKAQGTANPGANFPVPGGGYTSVFQATPLPAATPITPNGAVVEDVIARVNDQIITRTEYERAQDGLVQQAKQDNWTPSEFNEKQRDLLRDMIDQQLLLSKGKELSINGDAETIRQLDDMRKRANLPDMEALQKAAEQQGYSFEDFKQNIRNQAITQQVVRDEVGRRIGNNLTPNAEQAYYTAHARDFEQPEQVHLSEILIPTPDGATDAQLAEAQSKADGLEAKLKGGANFADVAKSSSGGPTAPAGGDLGDFKRGTLGDVLEKATFSLPVGQFTEPIRTRQGFVILRADSHQQAGAAPLQQVEGQVQEAIYMSQLQPALRAYLTEARDDAFVEIKPGFTDSGSARADSRMAFTSYTPPPLKKRVVKKQAAEQAKAVKAEQELADARAKLAQKQATDAASRPARGGVVNTASPRKQKRIKREKVRYGQAPRNALPAGATDVASAVPSLGSGPVDPNKALGGEAPGAAMGSPTQSLTTITTGTSADSEDVLAPKPVDEKKTRFASRAPQADDKRAQLKLASAEVKATKRPTAATAVENADEKVQAAPLGLTDAAGKKKSRHKRSKDQPKERLQEKVKPVDTPAIVAPTVNPALGSSATGDGTPPAASTKTSDRTALPSAQPTPANPAAPGLPIPAATSASPNAPATTAQPPQ